MKIRLLSDLHLEGYKFKYSHQEEDVLVLAGDIVTSRTLTLLPLLLDSVPPSVTVLFVAGNHEYYHGIKEETDYFFRNLESRYDNFYFLNNDFSEIDGVSFFGGTMFTDFMLYGPYEQWFGIQACTRINDFYQIQTVSSESTELVRWTPERHKQEHYVFCRELERWLKDTEDKKRVVISHFAPHPSTVDPKYGKSPTNQYFTEDMTRYMGWEGLWLYGHTHSVCDIMEGDTRIISNAKGYGDETIGFNHNLIVEI